MEEIETKEYNLIVNKKEYYVYETREDEKVQIHLYDKSQDEKLGTLSISYNDVDSFVEYELEQFKKETLSESVIEYLNKLITSIENKENIIYITDLEVSDKYRGNGIGAILLDIFGELLKDEIKLGFNDSIYLNACPTDAYSDSSLPLENLKEFYKRRGFKSFHDQGVNDNMLIYDTKKFKQKNKISLKEVMLEKPKEKTIDNIVSPKI